MFNLTLLIKQSVVIISFETHYLVSNEQGTDMIVSRTFFFRKLDSQTIIMFINWYFPQNEGLFQWIALCG